MALPRRQRLSSPSGPVDLAGLARRFFGIYRWHRSRLLSVLHQLEPVSDPTRAERVGNRGVSERVARAHRSAGAEVEGDEMREAKQDTREMKGEGR